MSVHGHHNIGRELVPLEEFLRPGVRIVDVCPKDRLVVSEGEVQVDYESAKRLYFNTEIQDSASKRLKGRLTMFQGACYLDVVTWCLATRSYGFNEKNVRNVFNAEIQKAWEYIDTLSVSSTPECRQMVSDLKDSRSASGFSRSVGRPLPSTQKQVHEFSAQPPPALLNHTEAESEGYTGYESMFSDQYTRHVFSSTNPTDAATEVHKSTLNRDQGF